MRKTIVRLRFLSNPIFGGNVNKYLLAVLALVFLMACGPVESSSDEAATSQAVTETEDHSAEASDDHGTDTSHGNVVSEAAKEHAEYYLTATPTAGLSSYATGDSSGGAFINGAFADGREIAPVVATDHATDEHSTDSHAEESTEADHADEGHDATAEESHTEENADENHDAMVEEGHDDTASEESVDHSEEAMTETTDAVVSEESTEAGEMVDITEASESDSEAVEAEAMTEESSEQAVEEVTEEASEEAESEEVASETEEMTEASTEVAEETTTEDIIEEAANDTATEEESSEETDEAPIMAQAASFDWQELGEKTYAGICSSCHQPTGAGIPSAFPPLAGHMPNLYNAEGGREYLINVVLYGLQGEIDVDGTSYNSVMTSWASLSDEEIAATLNHELSSWGNDALVNDFSPIMPEEIAAERDKGLAMSDMLELRPELP